MSIKETFRLNSGWGWGIFGFCLSTLISWMAPFGRLPRQAIEKAYERFERRLVQKEWRDGLSIVALDVSPLLDYPGNEIDFTGELHLKNTLSTSIAIEHVTLQINGSLVPIRLWQPGPGRLAANENGTYKFFTERVPRTADGIYDFQIEVVDELKRKTTIKQTRGS